ncbi:hypothetical protein [Nocardia sp. Marseille-Q1738]
MTRDGKGYDSSEYLANSLTFPFLVKDVSVDGARHGSASSGAATIQRTIDAAMRKTLGRLPQNIDSKAFVAALNESFEVQQLEGRTDVTWRARSYAGQTELGGGVTGSQASLYARARVALAQTLPLLENLQPLSTKADPEEMEAARIIVKTQFISLVDELGVVGGPRPAKVDLMFKILLEEKVDEDQPEKGMIGYLGFVAGMERKNVITTEEDSILSSFVLACDYLKSMRTAWTEFKAERGHDFGTRLVLLSNTLQVVAESVDEIEASLDLVFVGTAERTVIQFTIEGDRTMLVSELLSWIRSFAAEEAPQLVQDGGRRGAGAIVDTANELANLVGKLVEMLEAGPTLGHTSELPAGMHDERVIRPFAEAQGYLKRAANLAEKVAAEDVSEHSAGSV